MRAAIIGLSLALLAAPAYADTPFGSSTPNGVAWADTKYGTLDVVRKFNTGLPKPLAARSTVVSFKMPAREVVAGRHDAYMRDWFRTAPKNVPIWWAYWHEPENNHTTAAARDLYRKAWIHLVMLERSVAPANLRSTYIGTLHSARIGTWDKFYPGDRWIDVIGWDGKIHTHDDYLVPARIHYAAAVKVSKAHGKPWGLAEMGATVFGKDYRARAEWMRDTYRWLDSSGARFGLWWDQDGGSRGDFRLLDAPSIDAMRWAVAQ